MGYNTETGLTGTITALITPHTKSGEYSLKLYLNHVQRQLNSGIDGLTLFGTTGEADFVPETTKTEFLYETVALCRTLRKTVPIIVGISDHKISKVIENGDCAARNGADIGLLTPLSYVKPRQDGIIYYFTEIADELRSLAPHFKLFVYNVPGRTAVNIEPLTLESLSKIPNIVGVKEASGNLDQLFEYAQIAARSSLIMKRPFTVLSGDDATAFEACSERGAKGVISVVSNFVPQRMKNMIDSVFLYRNTTKKGYNGNLDSLFKASMLAGNPQSTLFIMQELNYEIGNGDVCLGTLTSSEKSQIREILSEVINQPGRMHIDEVLNEPLLRRDDL